MAFHHVAQTTATSSAPKARSTRRAQWLLASPATQPPPFGPKQHVHVTSRHITLFIVHAPRLRVRGARLGREDNLMHMAVHRAHGGAPWPPFKTRAILRLSQMVLRSAAPVSAGHGPNPGSRAHPCQTPASTQAGATTNPTTSTMIVTSFRDDQRWRTLRPAGPPRSETGSQSKLRFSQTGCSKKRFSQFLHLWGW